MRSRYGQDLSAPGLQAIRHAEDPHTGKPDTIKIDYTVATA